MWAGRERGVALIAVLWLLVILSLIAVWVSFGSRTDGRIALNFIDYAATQAAADAGIQRVILDLIAHDPEKKFRADGTTYSWYFAGEVVRISLRDESDKVNVNTAPAALMEAWFGSMGFDPSAAQTLANTIVDFRDPDNLTRIHGAEESDYHAAGLTWGPKNSPFESVEELQQVVGITSGIYERVAPSLTVYSVGAPIDPTAAGERLTEILRQAGGTNLLVVRDRVYSIRSEAFSSSGGRFVREAVVERPSSDRPMFLSWRQGIPQKRKTHSFP